MKKFFAILLTGVLTFGMVGCGGGEAAETPTDDTAAEGITLKIGACPTPQAEILGVAKEELAAKGINLEIIEFTDYVQPNLALDTGDLDANYFQHSPYLETFNAEHNTDLVSIGMVHFEPMAIYAGTVTDLSDIPEGTKVGIPNDSTNGGRALLLLEENGLLTLNPDAGINATKLDVVENPLNLEIIDMEAAQLPLSLSDLGFAVINGNYAMQNGLSKDDSLAMEGAESTAAQTYGNVVVVKAGNEHTEGMDTLMEVLHGETVTTFINDTYNGAVAPIQ